MSNAGNPIEEYATFHQLAFVVTDAVRQEYVSWPHRELFPAYANYHVVGRKNRRCSWAPRYSVIIGLVANQTDSFTATISNRCSIRQIVASSRRNTHYHV